MRLTVIIPTLNESAYLSRCVAALLHRATGPRPKIILADCGSRDDTVAQANRLGLTVVTSPNITHRATACNAAATHVKGDILLFLHADCLVPHGYDAKIFAALADPRTVGGAFEFKLDGPQWQLRIVERINHLRYRIRGRFYGDQGIFVRRSVFQRVGGFPDQGILEDAHFCSQLRRVGKTHLIKTHLPTSPRRFYNGGILTTLARDILIVLTDLAGLNAQRFATGYRQDNLSRGSHSPDRPPSPETDVQPMADSATLPTQRATPST